MKAYGPNTQKGRTVGVGDAHHKAADQPKCAAKALRHAARQDAKKQAVVE